MKSVLVKGFKVVRRSLMARLTVDLHGNLEEDILDTMIRKMFRAWGKHIYLPDVHWQNFYRDQLGKTRRNRSKPRH